MLEAAFILLSIALISFIPILLWGYLFAYIDDTPVGNTRFFAGIFGGILAVVPVIYIDQIAEMTGVEYLNSFLLLDRISDLFSSVQFGASLVIGVCLIAMFSLLSVTVFHSWFAISKIYVKNVGVIIILVTLLVAVFYGLSVFFSIFPGLNISSGTVVGGAVDSSLKFIIFYYIVVGVIEESAKHFNFLQSSLDVINSSKIGVLYAIFIALGFSFIENILYLYNEYTHNGVGEGFLKIYFFRSIFSVIVHVLASSLIGYYFSKAFLNYKQNKLFFPYMKVLLYGIFWGVMLHSLFDIGLSFGLSFIIVLYFLGGYFYVTSLLYRD